MEYYGAARAGSDDIFNFTEVTDYKLNARVKGTRKRGADIEYTDRVFASGKELFDDVAAEESTAASDQSELFAVSARCWCFSRGRGRTAASSYHFIVLNRQSEFTCAVVFHVLRFLAARQNLAGGDLQEDTSRMHAAK